MQILNTTKKTEISRKATFVTSLKDRAIGLISSEKPTTIIFETRFGIHTFGMHYPIDVLVLNKEKKVVAIKENLKPNRFFLWRAHGSLVIELAAGTIEQSKTILDDQIQMK